MKFYITEETKKELHAKIDSLSGYKDEPETTQCAIWKTILSNCIVHPLLDKPIVHMGWECATSPTGHCDYRQEDGTYDEDCCRYCGEPDERK